MKNVILLIAIVIFWKSSIAQDFAQRNCDDFRDGKFYIDTPEAGRTFISRDGNLQIEFNPTLGYHCISTVEWINDCRYRLTMIENKSSNQSLKLPENSELLVSIVELKANAYRVNIVSSLLEAEQEFEVFRLDGPQE